HSCAPRALLAIATPPPHQPGLPPAQRRSWRFRRPARPLALPGDTILKQNILRLHELRLNDLARVGGKNSSLGEMIGNLAGLGVSVQGGFATPAEAFQAFIAPTSPHQRTFDRLARLAVKEANP